MDNGDDKNTTKRAKKQRTLEEALAGRRARQYVVNRSEEVLIKDGKRYSPGFLKGKRKFKEGGGWFRWATDPTHPKYTPELAEKHYRMIQENGRKGAITRRSTPIGYRAAEWKPIWKERLESAMAIVDKLIDQDLMLLPDDELERTAAKEALVFNVALVRSSEFGIDARLKASRHVLDFTRSKPVARQEITVQSAEEWLAAIAAED